MAFWLLLSCFPLDSCYVSLSTRFYSQLQRTQAV